MRHVDPPQEPLGWQTRVFDAGQTWLNKPGKNNRNAERATPLWGAYGKEIGEAFKHICCYTCVWVPGGGAGHFRPWAILRNSPDAHLVYDWSNIRYSDGWINSSKGTQSFPDPFEVQDDWFELKLPSLELHATGRHPSVHDQAVKNLLERVKDNYHVMPTRREHFRLYQEGELGLKALDRLAPLLSRALRANPSFLTAADFARHQAGTL